MATYLTAVPAYGRDYKSQKEVKEAWAKGDDFRIDTFMSPYDGKYINKADKPADVVLNIRFKNLTGVCVIK